METLSRQLDEVDALRSVYPDDDTVVFSNEEQNMLKDAAQAISACDSQHDAHAPPGCLSGCINIPGISVHGAAVTIRFTLPIAYPHVSPSLQLIANAPREHLDELSAELTAFAAENVGEEVLLLCVDRMATLLQERLDAGALTADAPSSAAVATAAPAMEPHTLMHAVVWFHHIKSQKKRRSMAAWSAELMVGGMYKVGYPGVLLLEGAAADVAEYVARLRSQRWKAMAVRGEQRRECGSAAELRALRRLPPRLAELQEEQLGEMGDACRAAGLHDLFLCALKLERA
eukprot:jgi/Ulvmu1/7685/UM038_0117.1